jgi:hypothetical protein
MKLSELKLIFKLLEEMNRILDETRKKLIFKKFLKIPTNIEEMILWQVDGICD